MLDYLRNLRKSEEEKRQEALNAYLDDALTSKQRQKMASDLAQDEALRAELEQIHLLKQQMHRLPQRRVRRNFTLDPALYGRPRREPLVQAYPILRTATVMAAFFFIFALTAALFLNDASGTMTGAGSAPVEGAIIEEEIAAAPFAEEADVSEMATEILEEVVEEPMITEDVFVPESEMPAEEAPLEEPEPLLESVERAAETAVQLEDGETVEVTRLVSPADDAALAAMPTMTAEASAGADAKAAAEGAAEPTAAAAVAEELQAAPTVVLTEPAMQLELRSTDVSITSEDAGGSIEESQAIRDSGSLLANNFGLIVLLLGVAFFILIVLTLMARRRL